MDNLEKKITKNALDIIGIQMIERRLLPGGVSYVLCSLIKNPGPEEEDPPRRICTRCFEGGPLPPGSWLGSCQIGDPPGGGVCSMMKVDKHMDSMLWIGCFRMPIDLELEVYG